jgi:hypothetical protein
MMHAHACSVGCGTAWRQRSTRGCPVSAAPAHLQRWMASMPAVTRWGERRPGTAQWRSATGDGGSAAGGGGRCHAADDNDSAAGQALATLPSIKCRI